MFCGRRGARVFGHPAQIPQADGQFDYRGTAQSLDLTERVTGPSAMRAKCARHIRTNIASAAEERAEFVRGEGPQSPIVLQDR